MARGMGDEGALRAFEDIAYPWLPTTIPRTISASPTIFARVSGSAKSSPPPMTTKTKVNAVIGYAWLISRRVIASIQVIDARIAMTYALMIHGFNNNLTTNDILSGQLAGRLPAETACHLTRNCAQTVSRIVENTIR